MIRVALVVLVAAIPTANATRNGLIAFVRNTQSGDQIVAITASGGKTVTLATEGDNPAWSHDGRRLAYQVEIARPDDSADIDLFIVNADGHGLVHIDRPASDEFMPSWSPDGKRLVFTRDDSQRESDEISPQSEICTVRVDGTGLKCLTHNNVREFSPAWSPDGRWIAWDRAADFGDIWIMRSDGTQKRKLVGTKDWDDSPSWSPTSQAVVFDTGNGLAVWSLEKRTLRRLKDTVAEDSLPAWSPDGRAIAFTRTTDAGYGVYVTDSGGKRIRLVAADAFAPAWQPLR